jgi:hypothetical protein
VDDRRGWSPYLGGRPRRNFSFCRSDKVTIPILPQSLAIGQRLREVKLHRARGGCLGAKSR